MTFDEVEYHWCPVDNTIMYEHEHRDRNDAYCSEECHDAHQNETRLEVMMKVSLKTRIPVVALDAECDVAPWSFEDSKWRVYRWDIEGGIWIVDTSSEEINFVSVVKSIEEVA